MVDDYLYITGGKCLCVAEQTSLNSVEMISRLSIYILNNLKSLVEVHNLCTCTQDMNSHNRT